MRGTGQTGPTGALFGRRCHVINDHEPVPPRRSPGRQQDRAADRDLTALQGISDWINDFGAKPHKDLGRAGTVCPFVPGSLERKVLWLAPEHVADKSETDVVELVSRYKRVLQEARPTSGDDER